MSSTIDHDEIDQQQTIEDRVRELNEIESELRLVAATDCSYAEYARTWLTALEEARDD
jgi:deoxyinosine 3'endonuclease (endonuclease V)